MKMGVGGGVKIIVTTVTIVTGGRDSHKNLSHRRAVRIDKTVSDPMATALWFCRTRVLLQATAEAAAAAAFPRVHLVERNALLMAPLSKVLLRYF